jgi:hypothetical protein
MYVQGQSFTVHLPERDIVFHRKDKLYVADFAQFSQAYASRVCTRAEEERARQAHELLKVSVYPSLQEAIHLVQDGNISNLLMLIAADIRRAYEMFREPVGAARGKMTQRKVSHAIYDGNLIMDEKKQALYSDVMHVDRRHFLVTVCEPLQLVMQGMVERESASALGIALQGQLELLRSKGFTPVHVHTDPQSSFRAITTSFENMVIDVSGLGDFVLKVDIKIRRIKEVYRSVKAGLQVYLGNYLL